MRSLPRMRFLVILSAALVPGLVSCAPGDDERVPPRGGQGLTIEGDDPQQATVDIRLWIQNDTIAVDPAELTVERNTVVRWTSDPSDAVWVVVFAATEAPFPNGKRVFNGGELGNAADQAMIRSDAATGEHKYWVFFPDGNGNYLMKDPKLVVIDDSGMGADSTD